MNLYRKTKIYKSVQVSFQDKLSSLLKTAENLKVKGLAEVNILIIVIIIIIIIIIIIMTMISMIIKLT